MTWSEGYARRSLRDGWRYRDEDVCVLVMVRYIEEQAGVTGTIQRKWAAPLSPSPNPSFLSPKRCPQPTHRRRFPLRLLLELGKRLADLDYHRHLPLLARRAPIPWQMQSGSTVDRGIHSLEIPNKHFIQRPSFTPCRPFDRHAIAGGPLATQVDSFRSVVVAIHAECGETQLARHAQQKRCSISADRLAEGRDGPREPSTTRQLQPFSRPAATRWWASN